MHERARAILTGWFDQEFPDWPHDKWPDDVFKRWFGGDAATDAMVKEDFGDDVEAVAAGSYDSWLTSSLPEGLAAVILMDQFTRNMYRGTAKMYSLDPKARSWCDKLAQHPDFQQLHPAGKMFLALPFMHEETMEGQRKSLKMLSDEADRLRAKYGEECPSTKAMSGSAGYSQKHLDIIEKWGRFPHRNELLGRESTQGEKQGLQDGTIEAF